MDDAQLLQAIRSGDPGAFDAFVDRYGRRLMAFGLRMCGQRQDAEDVFQDTLLMVYKSLEDLRDPAALRAWLFRIVANQCRMKRRKEIPSRELPPDYRMAVLLRDVEGLVRVEETTLSPSRLRKNLQPVTYVLADVAGGAESPAGFLPAHWAFGAFFTATSMIGFIALAGIMVRNSVLLIDFVNSSLAEGRSLGEALVEAGAVRLRPILLTAGTVVVGAFVILFDPIFQGLAIALMAGAVASTALEQTPQEPENRIDSKNPPEGPPPEYGPKATDET